MVFYISIGLSEGFLHTEKKEGFFTIGNGGEISESIYWTYIRKQNTGSILENKILIIGFSAQLYQRLIENHSNLDVKI